MIPEKVKKLLKSGNILSLATSSKAGVPNVVAAECMEIINDKIILADCHFNKTRSNLKENPRASILITDGKEYFQIKGKAEYKTSGKEFDKLKVEIKKAGYPLAGAALISADEIYDLITYKRIV